MSLYVLKLKLGTQKTKTYFVNIEWIGIFGLKDFPAEYIILVLILPFMDIH